LVARGGGAEIGAVYHKRDGTTWATCRDRLLRFEDGSFRVYAQLPVRNRRLSWAILADDLSGDLWVAGRNGLLRLSLQGVSYGAADGLGESGADSLVQSNGVLYAVNNEDPSWARFDGRGFARVPLAVPAPIRHALLDHEGAWWVSSGPEL